MQQAAQQFESQNTAMHSVEPAFVFDSQLDSLLLLPILMFLCCAVLYEMSKLLQTGLSRDQLSLCITLCETGSINPESLASAIKELKREAVALQQR